MRFAPPELSRRSRKLILSAHPLFPAPTSAGMTTGKDCANLYGLLEAAVPGELSGLVGQDFIGTPTFVSLESKSALPA